MSDRVSVVYIYALVDPRDSKPRYVGASINPEFRMAQHRSNPMTADMGTWFDDLAANSLSPRLDILESVDDAESPVREKHWIGHYHSEGCLLFNRNCLPCKDQPWGNLGANDYTFKVFASVPQAAKLIGISQVSVRAAMNTGRLRHGLMHGRKVIHVDDIADFTNRRSRRRARPVGSKDREPRKKESTE